MTLEKIIEEIIQHDKEHPDHGVGCICIDEFSRRVRVLMRETGIDEIDKSRANLRRVFWYLSC